MDAADTAKVDPGDRYREYWAYLRHIETMRFHLASVLVAVTVGTLGFVAGRTDVEVFGRVAYGPVALLGLCMFIGSAQMFLVASKLRYGEYLAELRVLDPGTAIARVARTNVFGPFFWILVMNSLTQGTVALLLVFLATDFAGWALAILGWASLAAPWLFQARSRRAMQGGTQNDAK